jgi:hypothetical protein
MAALDKRVRGFTTRSYYTAAALVFFALAVAWIFLLALLTGGAGRFAGITGLD